MNISEAVYQHNDQLNGMIGAMDQLLAHMRGPIPENKSPDVAGMGRSALLGDIECTGRKINELNGKLSEMASLILSSAVLGKTDQMCNGPVSKPMSGSLRTY